MTDAPIDSLDFERDVRRRCVCRLYLRGFLPLRMVLVLQVDEATIRVDVAALLEEWTFKFGSVEAGECAATYRAIDEISNRHADRPGLSALELNRTGSLGERIR